MSSHFTVVYDACVLYPAPLRDLLMHLALSDLYRARWSDTIHDEWTRNVLASRPDLTAEQLNRTRQLMNSHVRDSLVTGFLGTRHEAYDGERLGPWRFAWQYSASFRNESFGGGARRTPPRCTDREVQAADGLRLRVVACLSAYRQLKGLHDLSVLVATRDHPTQAVLGRFDARGVDLDNALRLTDHYLKGFAWMPGAR